MHSVKDYGGYFGKISFDENGDPNYVVSVMEFVDGESILVN